MSITWLYQKIGKKKRKKHCVTTLIGVEGEKNNRKNNAKKDFRPLLQGFLKIKT